MRLVTFGCSYTYGVGLVDCRDRNLLGTKIPASNPSQQGWAYQLSNLLDAELVNCSFPGASNMEILYTVLDFEFEPTDTAVIMWTNHLRDMVFTKFFKTPLLRSRLGVWKKGSTARKWIDQMNEQDYAMKSWIHIHHAGLHLKDLGIKYIHYPAVPRDLQEHPLPNLVIPNLYLDGIPWLDKATDNGHPGPKSNKETARIIYEILNGTK